MLYAMSAFCVRANFLVGIGICQFLKFLRPVGMVRAVKIDLHVSRDSKYPTNCQRTSAEQTVGLLRWINLAHS